MNFEPYRKQPSTLTNEESIAFLNMLKTESLENIARYFEISLKSAEYQRRKFKAYDEEGINRAIKKLEKDKDAEDGYYERDFARQEVCLHRLGVESKMMFTCICTLRLSEDQKERIMEIINSPHQVETKKLIEVTL